MWLNMNCNISFVHKNARSGVNSSSEVVHFSRQFANRFKLSSIFFAFSMNEFPKKSDKKVKNDFSSVLRIQF